VCVCAYAYACTCACAHECACACVCVYTPREACRLGACIEGSCGARCAPTDINDDEDADARECVGSLVLSRMPPEEEVVVM